MSTVVLSPYEIAKGNDLFPGQLFVQIALLLIAAVSVPVMLLPKPLLLWYNHKRAMRKQGHGKKFETMDAEEEEGPVGSDSEGSAGNHEDDEEEEEFDFSEIFVHQIIHTIEFVLGCISNTASYLRLWALSLAHSELATVFWNDILIGTALKPNVIVIFGAWAVWAGATIGVLLVMEALSAFLHALRLHWVEFQNKFFRGDGEPFKPLSYERLLSGEDEDE